MTHGICLHHFDEASLEHAASVLDAAMGRAGLRRHSDYISRVWVFCTPHFAPIMADIAHMAMSKTNCLNIWGACVSGLMHNQQLLGSSPAVLVAIFGKAYEGAGPQTPMSKLVHFELAETDPFMEGLHASSKPISQTSGCVSMALESSSTPMQANTLGLLSYGANYARMPRIEQGRLCQQPITRCSLLAHNPLVFNSEGLTFLSEPLVATEANGLLLQTVSNQPARDALHAPKHQPKPVGLRLQVVHADGEVWIPVMDILPDGTLSLAAPVVKGQRVRLAMRSPDAMYQELHEWASHVASFDDSDMPTLGIVFSGFERSQLCNTENQDMSKLIEKFEGIEWLGVFGQAAWLGQDGRFMTPPRNNRLTVCLLKPYEA